MCFIFLLISISFIECVRLILIDSPCSPLLPHYGRYSFQSTRTFNVRAPQLSSSVLASLDALHEHLIVHLFIKIIFKRQNIFFVFLFCSCLASASVPLCLGLRPRASVAYIVYIRVSRGRERLEYVATRVAHFVILEVNEKTINGWMVARVCVFWSTYIIWCALTYAIVASQPLKFLFHPKNEPTVCVRARKTHSFSKYTHWSGVRVLHDVYRLFQLPRIIAQHAKFNSISSSLSLYLSLFSANRMRRNSINLKFNLAWPIKP